MLSRIVCLLIVPLCFLGMPSHAGTLSICDQVIGNLVLNCGFETGNLSFWTVVGNNDDGNSRIYPFSPDSGSYDFAMGNYPNQGLAGVSQVVSDIPGASYGLTFWLMNSGWDNAAYEGGAQPVEQFQVRWNGNPLLDLTDQSGVVWTSFTYALTGTGSDTLTFEGYSLDGFDNVDDIVLRPQSLQSSFASNAPEPTPMVLLVPALLASAFVVVRRKEAL